ncbi:hypothetical protein I317_05755 [Kwoniella heveanensis CBS 569]|nr:hypothetical protein I317_05755 [Kwoniella heveanensis CBS 569]
MSQTSTPTPTPPVPEGPLSRSTSINRPPITPEVEREGEDEDELPCEEEDDDDEAEGDAFDEGTTTADDHHLPRTRVPRRNGSQSSGCARSQCTTRPERRRKSQDDKEVRSLANVDGHPDLANENDRQSKRPRLSAEESTLHGNTIAQEGARRTSSQSSQPSPPTTPPSPSAALIRHAVPHPSSSSPTPASTASQHRRGGSSSSAGRIYVDRDLLHPAKPRIKSGGIFWRSNIRPPLNETTSSGNFIPPGLGVPDIHLGLKPLTVSMPEDEVVKTLGISSSFIGTLNEGKQFTITRADLTRYRMESLANEEVIRGSNNRQGEVAGGGREAAADGGRREWNQAISIAQACWKKWEESGGLPKGMGELLGFAYDQMGDPYKPDITHVQAIRLVIAASPKRMMTLAQIYQAIEERWPWHATAGATWKNSIRHNLSLNDCFVNIERPTHEGNGGKGGYWTVNDDLSGKTARKIKRPGQNPARPAGSSGSATSVKTPVGTNDTNLVNTRSRSSSYPYPSPTKSASGDYFASEQQRSKRSYPGTLSGASGERSRGITPPSATSSAGIHVFTPPSAPSADAAAGTKHPNSAQTHNADKGNKGKYKIAKPATPYPYVIPQKPPNWVPDEVIWTSREIGLSRPAHDTPLDKPPRAKATVSDSAGRPQTRLTASARPLLVKGPAELSRSSGPAPGPGPSSQTHKTILSGSGYSESTSLGPVPATRAGIPPLPTVEPRARARTSSSSENLAATHAGVGEEVLPSLMQVIYQPRPRGEGDDVELPPVEDRSLR